MRDTKQAQRPFAQTLPCEASNPTPRVGDRKEESVGSGRIACLVSRILLPHL